MSKYNKQPKVEYKGFYMASTIAAIALVVMPELAMALPKGPETLALLAEDIKKDIHGSGLNIALNATGLAAIGYSLFNGFNKTFLVAGLLILGFANTYFPFVEATVKPA